MKQNINHHPYSYNHNYKNIHNDFHTTHHLQLIPFQLCYCVDDVKGFAKHHPTITQFVFRARDGAVVHTGTLCDVRQWIASQPQQPFYVQMNVLHQQHHCIDGFRFVFTPDGNTMYKRIIIPPTLTQSRFYSTESQALTLHTTHTQYLYKHAEHFVNTNRERLPVNGHIDICAVDSCQHYITDIHWD